MSPVVLLLAVLVGVALGLLGGGGSILTVPLLVYVAGLEAKEAIATSLLVVGVTSLAALVPHARAGRVMWRHSCSSVWRSLAPHRTAACRLKTCMSAHNRRKVPIPDSGVIAGRLRP